MSQFKYRRRGGSLVPIPRDDGGDVWPPRHGIDFTITSILKRIEAVLRRGELVWFRDYDETQTLSVAIKNHDGDLVAARHWPNHNLVVLNEDGSVQTDDETLYIRHWISAKPTQMVYMTMQNSETYTAPIG